MPRLLIEGGMIVPMDARDHVIENGIVAIEDDRIVHVSAADEFDQKAFGAHETISARGRAVLPGLINTHIHLIGAYLKGVTEDTPGRAGAGLFNRALPILAECRDPQDTYWGCLAHAAEMVMSGTTTLANTWHKETNVAPAARDIGVRASLSEMLVEIGLGGLNADTTERPWRPERLERAMEAAEQLHTNWHGEAEGRITVRISPGGPGYTSLDGMAKSRELADRLGVGMNVHIAEVPGETEFTLKLYGKRPMELGIESGVLAPDTVAIHCVFMNDEDINLLAASGATLSHTSYHVAKRGYFPPMEKVYGTEINVALGSDWCSNDLWQFMKFAILIPRTLTGNVEMLSGWDALEMATMSGARGLGMAREIGSLEVGKKADIILVDVSRPWFRPIRQENFCSNLVYNASGADVTDVVVDGRCIVRNRDLTTVDLDQILNEVQGRAEAIWLRAEKNF